MSSTAAAVVIAPALRAAAATLLLRRTGSASNQQLCVRRKTHYRTGAIKPMPKVLPFGVVAVFASIIPGLFIGAAVSKSVANFLEENDLFVPSDDDEDDD